MTDTTALIERFNWLRDSGVCSPTTRKILDDAESALASVRTENEAHREALFQVMVNLGEDTDGIRDAAYWDRVVTPKLVDSVPGLVAEFRTDSEVDFARVDDARIAARARVTELEAKITKALARLQEPVHPYGDKRIPQVPEIDFLRDAYGEDLPNDLLAALSTDSKDGN